MAIYVITGKPRHGKTYFLASLIVQMLKNGERIYSNLKINVGEGALKKLSPEIIGDLSKVEDRKNPNKQLFYYRSIHEWEHMEKGTIIADEATRYFNARQWALLSPETEIKLQQHGKEDLDIWMTTQHYTRIDASLRLLTEKFYIVETTWGNPDNKKPFLGLKRFTITEIELEDLEKYYRNKENPELDLQIDITTKNIWFRKKIGKIYDTRQTVGSGEDMPLVHRTRTCPICGKEEIKHL